VAVIKINYRKSRKQIKVTARYIQHRPGRDGERRTRQFSGLDGPLTRDDLYDLIDNAPKGTNFFRLVISPDPRKEDTERDLDLRAVTEHMLSALGEKLGQQIAYAGAIHDDHAPHRHVHVIALIQGKLTREHFTLLREHATEVALLQRRERDLARGIVREEPAPGRTFPRGRDLSIPAGGGSGPAKRSNRCVVCGQEHCLLHDLELELER
jgi:hypothetical protein